MESIYSLNKLEKKSFIIGKMQLFPQKVKKFKKYLLFAVYARLKKNRRHKVKIIPRSCVKSLDLATVATRHKQEINAHT